MEAARASVASSGGLDDRCRGARRRRAPVWDPVPQVRAATDSCARKRRTGRTAVRPETDAPPGRTTARPARSREATPAWRSEASTLRSSSRQSGSYRRFHTTSPAPADAGQSGQRRDGLAPDDAQGRAPPGQVLGQAGQGRRPATSGRLPRAPRDRPAPNLPGRRGSPVHPSARRPSGRGCRTSADRAGTTRSSAVRSCSPHRSHSDGPADHAPRTLTRRSSTLSVIISSWTTFRPRLRDRPSRQESRQARNAGRGARPPASGGDSRSSWSCWRLSGTASIVLLGGGLRARADDDRRQRHHNGCRHRRRWQHRHHRPGELRHCRRHRRRCDRQHFDHQLPPLHHQFHRSQPGPAEAHGQEQPRVHESQDHPAGRHHPDREDAFFPAGPGG